MLKYLWTAVFEDGSVIQETQEDVSVLFTGEGKRPSMFWDVENCGKKVVEFQLNSAAGDFYEVDLITGEFVVNGSRMIVEGGTPIPINYPDFRLVFYRQHQHDALCKVKDNIITSVEETEHRVRYFIGWQTTIVGKNYQSVIGIT